MGIIEFIAANGSLQNLKPCLEIVEQPTDKPFRFRYKSEMHGTREFWEHSLWVFLILHVLTDGSLMGIKTERSKRTYPAVTLRNFGFISKATVLCSLYQVPNDVSTTKRSPHSHKLVIRRGDSEESDPHQIEVSSLNDFTATWDY